jgi:outer membrane immunogenic protein
VIKKLVAAAAFVALGAGSVLAADLAPQPYVKAPMAPVFSWTGFYLGGTIGGGIHNSTIDDKDCNLSCSSLAFSKAFGTVGGTAGYNYQFGPGVVGIEGDINWSSFKDSLADPNWDNPSGSFHSTKSEWFSTVRGRFGLAVDRVLIYGTGGVAFVDRNVTGNDIAGTCTRACFSIKETAVGAVGGVGAEYAFAGPWSIKAEYLYVMTPTARAQDLNTIRALRSYNQYAVTDTMQVLRLGVNYRFGY